ncbi:MAG TPA: hypothetical protein VD794_12915 [Flavisolibacter sp.]|nr:hypothetical protein [Flavisolibacter sp.]
MTREELYIWAEFVYALVGRNPDWGKLDDIIDETLDKFEFLERENLNDT